MGVYLDVDLLWLLLKDRLWVVFCFLADLLPDEVEPAKSANRPPQPSSISTRTRTKSN